MSRWKATERWYARQLNGERVPVTGRQGKLRVSKDIETPYPIWVDVKSRKTCPVTVWRWLENVADNAPQEMIPAVIMHRPGMRRRDGVVVIRWEDFRELLERAYGDRPQNT